MKSVLSTQQLFSQVVKPQIQRSKFDRSHGAKTTMDAGKLVPIFVDEALPGDTMNLSISVFARLTTPIKPFMDNLFADVHFFSVPNRLVWDNWKKFNGEQKNPADSTNYIMPIMTAPVGGYGEQSLFDYMGLPTKVAGYTHTSLPLRCVNLIWNEWFRDENLQNSVTVNTGDSADPHTDYSLLDRGKRKDYFTSALPWAQKGTAVTLPLGSSAEVKRVNNAPNPALLKQIGTNSNPGTFWAVGANADGRLGNNSGGSSTQIYNIDPQGSLYADLSSATSATINAIRQAFQVQRMYERDARGGTRYTEIIRSHFGVISPDARLQRPEFLGSLTAPININPIAQTAPTVSGQTPQGNLSAMGTTSIQGHVFSKSFTEHEYIIGFISIRADLNYQQGLNRMWSRSTRFDFFWPTLAHLGEQAILNKEIYCQGTSADDQVFGYQERYAEYRYKPSQITGKFRSNTTTPLDMWHLAQKFTTLPLLNSTFIVENPPLDRVVAVTTEPKFLVDTYFKYICARPMPLFSVPGLLDHF